MAPSWPTDCSTSWALLFLFVYCCQNDANISHQAHALKYLNSIFQLHITDISLQYNYIWILPASATNVQVDSVDSGGKLTYGFMLKRSRTATLALHSRLRLRSVNSLSLVQVMWTRSGAVSTLSLIAAWDAVFLSWMSWAWRGETCVRTSRECWRPQGWTGKCFRGLTYSSEQSRVTKEGETRREWGKYEMMVE